MAFRFLHTGDWHIGKPFGGFDDDTAPLLRRARLDAIGRIADAARKLNAEHVLVAGDIYDQQTLPDKALRELMQRLRTADGLIWHLIPGNHDPARDDGVWLRLNALGVPDNVRIYETSQVVALAPDVDLLVAPCTSHRSATDPTGWMDRSPRRDGVIRIGLAHGPVQGFGSEGEAAGMINQSRRQSAGLDYLALGDWHGLKEVCPGVWYAGTPEPDQFPDNEPGFALAVELDGPGAAPRVERIPIATYRWIRKRYTFGQGVDLAAIRDGLLGIGKDVTHSLLRVDISGEASLREDAELRAFIEELSAAYLHLEARLEGLSLRLDDNVDASSDGGPAAPVMARLKARMADVPDECAVTQRALQLLAGYERTTARQVR